MIEQTQVSGRKMKGVDFSNAGPENENHLREWRHAMDYARVEIDLPTLKQSFLGWAKVNRDIDERYHWDALAPWQYATIGRMTFCMDHGAVMPDQAKEWFESKLVELLKVQVVAEEPDDDIKLSLTGRRTIEYVNMYSSLEAVWRKYIADTAKIEEETKKRLDRYRPNQQMLKRLYDHFKESFADAMRDKENRLVAETIEPIVTVLNVLATSTGNAKAASSSKDVSRKSIKQASKAKFKTVDLNTDMASLSPAMIPGSNKAVIYNSKSRKLYVYAAAEGELGIKGTKITGYDEAKSFAKTLRDPKKVLVILRDAATVKRVDLVMNDNIKGKRHPVNGRLNKDTLVIKVFR
jgi:hypothetical protein